MRNLSSQEKLWHTPLVLTVRVQGQPVTIPMDKRSLTVCKHNLQNGHSAELFSDGPLSVVYTRLNTPGSAIIAVRYQNDDIGILAVQGRAFEESLSTNKDTNVHGLTKLAEAIVSRHALVPSIPLSNTFTTALPPYTNLNACKQTLRSMQFALPRPVGEHQRRVYQSLLREKLITESNTQRPLPRRRFTGLPGAHLLLKFNNNFISRMVSASAFNNLFQARGICLNVAAAQGFQLPPEKGLLGSTLETMDLKTAASDLLEKVRTQGKPSARVAYIDTQGNKQKIPVFALTDIEKEALTAVNITTRKPGLPTYVAFTASHTPILLGDFTTTQSQKSPDKAAAYLKAGGEVLTRRWLAAACNYHPELTSALCILSRAAAPDTGSVYGYNPVPALDLWAEEQIEREM